MDIQELVDRREMLRKVHEWDTADRIREQLRSMGVQLNEATKEWIAPDGRRGPLMAVAAGTVHMPQPEIEALVGQREVARRAHDWGTADAIRNKLRGAAGFLASGC